MIRVLLVEDEPDLAEPLAFLLERDGFAVTLAGDGPTALARFAAQGFDVVLLDLMLPGMPGTEVCRRLRARSSVPVIMVTARDAEADVVMGLELGADDYVTKPYSARTLVARIRAVLRRTEAARADEEDARVTVGAVVVDTSRHAVTVDGVEVPMPMREFTLLELLVRNAGRALTRAQIIDRVWGSDYVGDTKTLDVHVKRVRDRIEPDPRHPTRLVTVRGLGYRYEAE